MDSICSFCGSSICVWFLPQAGVSVLIPESICNILKGCTRLCPHFDFSQDEATPTTHLIPPLSKFTVMSPFEATNKSMELAPPKKLVCCASGDGDQPSPAKKSCC